MAGSKPGERRGGRQKGARNKATIEREARAMMELRDRAKVGPVLKKLAKDHLAELVPVTLGIVAMHQRAAIKDDGSGAPGKTGYDPKAWQRLGEWIELARRVADTAADYESPKYRAIAVAVNPGEPAHAEPPAPAAVEHEPADENDRERIANNAYLRLVKG